MEFSLVIPCYNEAANLPLLIQRCAEVVKDRNTEIILVDNGSTDNTQTILKEYLSKYPFLRSVRVEVNQGYGFGILAGLKSARGRFIGWSHADMQTDPGDYRAALELILNHPDPARVFVKGKRKGRPIKDTFFTVGMACFETLFLQCPLWDINAQPTIFPKEFFETWKNPPHDFALDLYAYYLAHKQGLHIQRFPVFFGKRAHGISHWNVNWKAKYKFIKRTMDYSIRLRKNLEKS